MTAETPENNWPHKVGSGVPMTPVMLLIYALAIPVILGLISGINESGSARMVSKEAYILRYITRGLLSWWVTILATYVIAVALKPWRPSFFLVLVFGPIISNVLNGPLSLIWQPLFEPYLMEGSQFYALWPWRFTDAEYLQEALLALLTNEIIWVSFNYVFWRIYSVRLYGFDPPTTQSGPAVDGDVATDTPGLSVQRPQSSAFLDRLPAELGTDIVALEAQEHYTKVYTALGSDLVLYRFGDAVKDLAALPGLKVHRSFWVNTDAIVDVDRSGRSYELTLSTGLKVPVSRSYKVKVDDLGLT